MKRLNAKSTRIFCVLMDSLVDGYRKIENKPYMPLSMEFIGTAQLNLTDWLCCIAFAITINKTAI
ncbi:hypothetical protein LWM68_08320 [Niabella sp. W65]|nr:hypothetical protein [Niabella sp. W65]MCH7362769.1 hypothetical protein [Niabella sp. W65]ULT38724.1 hypothetical protein KRR40_26995 [Niabella sp. I65]